MTTWWLHFLLVALLLHLTWLTLRRQDPRSNLPDLETLRQHMSQWEEARHQPKFELGNLVTPTLTWQTTPWAGLGQVVFINMKDATARRAQTEAQLQAAWPELHHVRLEAFHHAIKGVGIMLSHIAALRTAAQVDTYTIIMEDDFEWQVTGEAMKQSWQQFLQVSQGEFDVFMPSPYVFTWARITEFGEAPFRRVLKATTATMYVVTPRYAQVLADFYLNKLQSIQMTGFTAMDYNDQIWETLQRRDQWFAPVTPWCTQRRGMDSVSTYANNSFRIDPSGSYIYNANLGKRAIRQSVPVPKNTKFVS